MLVITDNAGIELKKVLESKEAENKRLIIYYQGAG